MCVFVQRVRKNLVLGITRTSWLLGLVSYVLTTNNVDGWRTMGINWFRSLLLLLIGVSAIHTSLALAEGKTPPKDLVKYVRDAKKAGLMDVQAQQKAILAGWSAAAVTDAIAEVYGRPAADVPKSVELPSIMTAPAQSGPNPANEGWNGKTHPTVSSGVSYDYKIGAGDVLDVSVWREPEASIRGVVVRPDGKISLPLLKDVQVAGLTPTDVEKFVTERLIKVIQEPDVTVIVTGTHSQRIYAVGAVKKEGPIPFTYQMSVMQAISEAGGLTEYAKRNKIYILRNENGTQRKLPFDYDGLLKGEHVELNIPLLPGDTLVVPH